MNNYKLPVVAIVGRPNVGKSSLFNRLINRRLAITSEIAGTTRDRIYHKTSIDGLDMVLVDTGGLEYGKKENIEADVESQVKIAISEADLIIFLVDAKEGLTVEDHEATKFLRRTNKPIIIAANKIDHKSAIDNLSEITALGFDEPIELSAYHNINVDGLKGAIANKLSEIGFTPIEEKNDKEEMINISFVGKPNSGKSSLVNAILGKEKVIVSDIAGTTRDAIDTEFTWENNKFNLIDTAGLRRRGKIERGLEKISSLRSIEAIERSDIACLILDYGEGVRKQDQHITAYIQDAGKGLILVMNKSDLMKDREEDQKRIIRLLRRRFDFLPWAPVIFVSALDRSNIYGILETAKTIQNERKLWIDEDVLTGFMKDIIVKHLPPIMSAKIPKFYSLKQESIKPPTFKYFVNDPTIIHFSYKRYLENEMRKKFGFTGTTIKLIFDKKRRN